MPVWVVGLAFVVGFYLGALIMAMMSAGARARVISRGGDESHG